MEISSKKMVDAIAKTFLRLYQSEDPYNPKKWKSNYFALRAFLMKREVLELKILYNYATSLSGVTNGDLTKFFRDAEDYRKSQLRERDETIKQTLDVKKYKEYDLGDIMNL